MGAAEAGRANQPEQCDQVSMSSSLREIFVQQQKAMRAKLEYELTLHRHPDARGDAAEEAWIAMLAAALPRRFEVAKAFVIDCRGTRSDQQDVVIHDRHFSPLLSDAAGGRYIPAEAVYAIFEVKQAIDRDEVLYAAEKAASVRSLNRTSASFRHLTGVAAADRPRDEILAGILAVRAGWNPPYGGPFRRALDDCVATGRLDLGCSLDGGAFEIEYRDGSGPDLTSSDPEIGLPSFLFTLLRRFQRMTTAHALDFGSYLGALER